MLPGQRQPQAQRRHRYRGRNAAQRQIAARQRNHQKHGHAGQRQPGRHHRQRPHAGHNPPPAAQPQQRRPVVSAQRRQSRRHLGLARPNDAARQQHRKNPLAGVQHEHRRRRLAPGRPQDVGHSRAATAEITDIFPHRQVDENIPPRQAARQIGDDADGNIARRQGPLRRRCQQYDAGRRQGRQSRQHRPGRRIGAAQRRHNVAEPQPAGCRPWPWRRLWPWFRPGPWPPRKRCCPVRSPGRSGRNISRRCVRSNPKRSRIRFSR